METKEETGSGSGSGSGAGSGSIGQEKTDNGSGEDKDVSGAGVDQEESGDKLSSTQKSRAETSGGESGDESFESWESGKNIIEKECLRFLRNKVDSGFTLQPGLH